MPYGRTTDVTVVLVEMHTFKKKKYINSLKKKCARLFTLAGVWDRSVAREFEEQWDSVFVSVPDKRRFFDSGELDICPRKY